MSKTYKPSRVASWIIFNGAYAFLLWRAGSGSDGAMNVVVFFTWLAAVASLGHAVSDEHREKLRAKGRQVPRCVANVTEIVLLATLVWHGCIWTAFAFLATAVAGAAIYDMDD